MAGGLEQGLLRGVGVSRRVQAPPFRVDAFAGPGVHVIVRGSFYLASGGPHALWLGPGDVVLLAGKAPDGPKLFCVAPPVKAAPAAPAELLSAAYAPEAGPRLSAAGHALRLSADDVRRDPGLSAIVGLLQAALADPASGRLAHSLLEPLAEYVLHCHGRLRAGAPARPRDGRVGRALELLRSRPADRWSVAALAKAVGLSRAAFARRFQAELGAPPLRYLAELRMQTAARLLADGDDSLAHIAAQIGYESEFAFSRAFKRQMGEAPSAFRRARRAARALPGVMPTRAAA